MVSTHDLLEAVREFAKLRQDQSASSLVAFLYIGNQIVEKGRLGVPHQEVRDLLGETPANVSRLLKSLTKTTAKRASGIGVCFSVEDPNDGRSKLVKLTAKGERVFKDIKSCFLN